MALPLKLLNACHADYDKPALELYEAFYEGGDEFDEVKRELMPMNAQEPPDLYEERMRLATYENHAGPLIDLVVAWLFSRPPTVDGIDPDWLSNVDRRGTSLEMFTRVRLTEALKYARDYTWINLPAPKPVASLADQEAQGLLRPFLVPLCAEMVRDWGRDDVGELAYVLARSEHSTRARIEDPHRQFKRWTWIDATQIRRWDLEKSDVKETDETMVTEAPAVTHGLGTLPVAAFDLPTGLHILGKLRDPVIGHVRTMNDFDWKLHKDAHSTLIIETADPEEPILGSGYFFRIGKGDKAYYASPNTAIYEAFAKREDAKREGIYRLVQAMAQGVSGQSTQQSASAASKALDWQSLSIMLTAYAEHVRAYLADLLRIVAIPLGVPPESIAIGGLQGWEEAEITKMLDDFLTSQGVVKSATFHRSLAKSIAARMMPGGTSSAEWPTVSDEIDGADYDAPEPIAPLVRPPPVDPAATG